MEAVPKLEKEAALVVVAILAVDFCYERVVQAYLA